MGETFQSNLRCPNCLTLGELRYQYGNYCCDKCDRCWRSDTLGHFMKAFEAGREFEKKGGNLLEILPVTRM